MRTKLDNTFLKFFGDLSEITKQIKSKTINNAYITKHYTYMNIIFLLLMIKESNCTHSPMDGKFLRKRISERRKKCVLHGLYSTVMWQQAYFFMIMAMLSIISRNYSDEDIYDIYQENMF